MHADRTDQADMLLSTVIFTLGLAVVGGATATTLTVLTQITTAF